MTTVLLIFSFKAPDTSHLLGTAERAKETNDLSPTSAPTAAAPAHQPQLLWELPAGFCHYIIIIINTIFKKQVLLVELNATRLVLH